MKYFIDTGNQQEIDEAMEWGAAGITANPSMYLKENVNFYDFLERNSKKGGLLTAEVIESHFPDMIEETNKIIAVSEDIIIKLNYSSSALKTVRYLRKKNIQTAMTLVFDMNQAMMALNAGVNYLFLFVARNEEIGVDGITFVEEVSNIIRTKNYQTKVVAASIRNKFQLNRAALYSDYMAAPYQLMKESFQHPSTLAGLTQFEKDMDKVLSFAEGMSNE
ncbi:transaldolase family protein [Oceanobacillus sojae]|uniref:transaldolase family protein n=1 Tax=Oceanobacillus sojae TaxID=582851 RepID=UPI0021A871A4|nr:transaldolase family protein [Oceanobacillus sojae]MCT1901964.1 fructose-6-phosphate aldolase [Oceanobacillus sojae]